MQNIIVKMKCLSTSSTHKRKKSYRQESKTVFLQNGIICMLQNIKLVEAISVSCVATSVTVTSLFVTRGISQTVTTTVVDTVVSISPITALYTNVHK